MIILTALLGPGKDDQKAPFYSLKAVLAYVVSDAQARIVDPDVDNLEIITPNHDNAADNRLAGWPGASCNADADGDGTVEGAIEETEERFLSDPLT